MNEVCDSCWMNHGCGEVSSILTVVASGALIADLALQRVALLVRCLGLQPLYSGAPLIP